MAQPKGVCLCLIENHLVSYCLDLQVKSASFCARLLHFLTQPTQWEGQEVVEEEGKVIPGEFSGHVRSDISILTRRIIFLNHSQEADQTQKQIGVAAKKGGNQTRGARQALLSLDDSKSCSGHLPVVGDIVIWTRRGRIHE